MEDVLERLEAVEEKQLAMAEGLAVFIRLLLRGLGAGELTIKLVSQESKDMFGLLGENFKKA